MKYKMLKAAFLVWVVLWGWFIARELFRKGYFYDYVELLRRPTLEGRKSYVTGDRLYEFLVFCNKNLPPGSRYDIVGLKEISIDIRRAVYYLYPNLRDREGPEFILVFGERDFKPSGFKVSVVLDDERYIMAAGRKR